MPQQSKELGSAELFLRVWLGPQEQAVKPEKNQVVNKPASKHRRLLSDFKSTPMGGS